MATARRACSEPTSPGSRFTCHHVCSRTRISNGSWRHRTSDLTDGIRERHVVDEGVATSDLAREAALSAIAQAGITPDDIDFIVVGTTTPDMMFPSTACLLQQKIGARRAWGFDLGAACSGFTYALTTGVHMVASGTHRYALVVGADVMSSIIDYTDRSTCVLFGDGAGAVVLGVAPDSFGIIDFEHEIDWKRRPRLCMPAGGSLRPASGKPSTPAFIM